MPDWELEIVVRDRNRFGAPVLGRCRVTMTEILAEQPFKAWVKLLDEQYRFGPEPLGEVLVGATLAYNKKARRSVMPDLGSFFARKGPKASERRDASLVYEAERDRLVTEGGDGVATDMPVTVAMFGEEREAWEREQNAAQALALKKQKQYAKRLAKIVPGDYQVQVHLIECRDLKPQDSSGTSDPFCYIKCSLGGAQKTATQKSNNSPLFDERIVFNYKDLTRQALQEATITLCVYDEDWFGLSRQMIGSCSFDLMSIYAKSETHEIYRSWMGLTDTEENNDEVGIQGYLKASITVLGPGDPIPVHDLDQELKDERRKEVEEPGAEGTMQFARDRKLQYIALSIAKATELLTTPSLILSSRVYARLEFAGNHISSSARVVSAADFMQQLWVPAYVPTMATRVVLSLWKKGGAFGSDLPLGHHYMDFSKFTKCKRESDLRRDLRKEGQWGWVNLYGAAVKGVAQKGSKAKIMNTFGEYASTFRGRVLVHVRTILRAPPNFTNVPVRKSIDLGAAGAPVPRNALYTLRAYLIQGCEIPVFNKLLPDLEEGSTVARMKVRVCIGANTIEWGFAANNKGMVVWNEMQEKKSIEFPEDFEMIPDAMIYLIRETDLAPVSFLRVPVVELLTENFSLPPKFFHLKPDRSRKAALNESEYAGSISMKLGFGRDEVARQNPWPNYAEQPEESAYCLRVHVYQARGLPASDESGTLDPYVKVRFNGNKAKTTIKEKTCDPCWYESLEIDQNNLKLPDDPDFCPEIVVRIWDSDGMFSKNQPVCGFHLPLKQATREVGQTSTLPSPKWYECFMCNDTEESPAEEGNKKGELLVSFQLIPKRTRNEVVRPAIDKVSEKLRPAFKLVWLDILAWGVRDLQGGSNPLVRFDIVGSDGQLTQYKSKRSSKPNGRNANFLERIVTSIELPEEIVYTPMLNIRVYDNAYGGLQTDLVGNVSVPLENKLPWSASYAPPQTEEFETPAKVDKAKMRMQARRDKAAGGAKAESEDEEEEEEEKAGGDKADDSDEEKVIEAVNLDPGLGAFDFLTARNRAQMWMVPEDAQALAAKDAPKAEAGLFSDWWGGKEADFKAAGTFSNDLPDPRELGIDIPDNWASKEWLEDRDGWIVKGGSGLEDFLKTSPFENYVLKKGCFKSNGTSTVRNVGKFKGLVSITEVKSDKPLVPLERVADYICRVYVWKADSLQPSDPNGKADPYVSVKLGGFSESGRKDHIKATLSPDFYKTYEIPMKIPGESQLKLSVYDWDRFHLPGTSDTLIGETTVDLEDRYFHKGWKALGAGTFQAGTTGPPKLIEARDLFIPESNNSQGKLYMWVEILPAGEARARPPVTFDRPPEQNMEVRVIVWGLSGYSGEGSSEDYYVKTYLKGQPKKKMETDTHWRSKTGGAQWNWRHKHQVKVPLDLADKGDLVVELWERNLVTSNDSLGAFTVPLSDWMKKCYIEQRSVKPFEEIHEKMGAEAQDVASLAHQAATKASKAKEEEAKKEEGGEEAPGKGPELAVPPKAAVNPMNFEVSAFADEDFDMEEAKLLGDEEKGDDDNDDEDSEAGDDVDDVESALLPTTKTSKKQKKPENIVDVLRELAGLPTMRDDAHWFDLGTMDVESGKFTTNGQLYISVELVPGEQAEASPVGSGRSEPNTAPYLPPPAGRLSIGMDPCSILCAIFAEYPGIVCCLCCCCCTVLLLTVFAFISTYLAGFSALGL